MKNKRRISGVDSHAQKETAHTPKGEGRQQNAPLNDTPPAVSGQCAEVLELLRNEGFMLPDASLLAGLLILAVAALLLIGGAA